MQLLADLRRDFGMAMILITHDLGVVAGSCERVAVMYGGRIRETGPVQPIFADPAHPYTQGLLDAIPRVDQLDEELRAIPGQPPNMSRPPSGCAFEPRCPYRRAECAAIDPPLEDFAPDRARACLAGLDELRDRRMRVEPRPDQVAAGDGAAETDLHAADLPEGAVAGADAAGSTLPPRKETRP